MEPNSICRKIKKVNFLCSNDNNPLMIVKNGNEAGQMDGSENIGIGTEIPNVKGARIRIDSPDGAHILDPRAHGAALYIESKGAPLFLNGTRQLTFLNPTSSNVSVGMRDSRFPLHVNGVNGDIVMIRGFHIESGVQ
jgi:hypothetical protein